MKRRMSNFELLRIISVILIIAHHYSVHGIWIDKTAGLSLNNAIIDFLAIGGKIGVSCFILITGYFNIKTTFSIKKLFKLVFEVLFYSIGIFIIFNLFKINGFDASLLIMIQSFLPITFSLYWFITLYIVIYMFSPYLNKLLFSLKKIELQKLILLLIIIGYIIPTFTTKNLGLGEFIIFITLYIIGGYLRIYYENVKQLKYKKYLIYFIICYILIFVSQLLLELMATKYTFALDKINYFIGLNKLPVLITSLLLFGYIKNLNIKNELINHISQTSLGVYLIHDNYFVRILLWQFIFKNNNYYQTNFLFIHAVIAIILTFVICVIIDIIRIKIFENNLLPLFFKLYDKFTFKFKQSAVYKMLQEKRKNFI